MISKRLMTIGDLLTAKSNVIDVGADHGELERYISSKVNKIVAIENKIGPYQILKNATKDLDNVTTYLSDGLTKIDETIDTVVIAGMGGHLINSILEKSKNKLDNVTQIVIDAHKDYEIVRRYICSLGFKIDKEILIYENKKYYFVINFLRGNNDYNSLEYEFGRIQNSDLFTIYKKKEIDRLTKIYSLNKDENVLAKIERMKKI